MLKCYKIKRSKNYKHKLKNYQTKKEMLCQNMAGQWNVIPNCCKINFSLDIKNIYECLKSMRALSVPSLQISHKSPARNVQSDAIRAKTFQ